MITPPDQKPDLSGAPLLQAGGLSREFTRIVLLVFVLVSVWQLAHQLVEILLMFAMVFLLAVILNSVVVTLEKRGVRRGLAVGLIMLSLISTIVLAGFLIVPPALKQANQLVVKAPDYWKNIRGRVTELEKRYPSLKQLWPELPAANVNVVSSRESAVKKSTTQTAKDKNAESNNENTVTAEASSEESSNTINENSDNASRDADGNAASVTDNEKDNNEETANAKESTSSDSGEAPVPPEIGKDKEKAPAENTSEETAREESSKTPTDKSADDKLSNDKRDPDTTSTVTRSVTTKTASATPKKDAEPLAPLASFLQQDALLGYAKSAVAITASLAGAVFVLVLSFLLLMFTLANPQSLVGGLLSMAPQNHREATRRSMARVFMQMTGWARATLINGTITGVLTGLGLAMVGVQPALVFGICAFFGEFVPNVGPLVAAAPAIFVALSMGPSKAAAALGVIVFVQAVASNALNPIIMGREMKLHPVTITFYALAMGKLFGVAGAILAVPAAATSKILIEEFYLHPQRINETIIEEQARGIVMNEAGIEEDEDQKDVKAEVLTAEEPEK